MAIGTRGSERKVKRFTFPGPPSRNLKEFVLAHSRYDVSMDYDVSSNSAVVAISEPYELGGHSPRVWGHMTQEILQRLQMGGSARGREIPGLQRSYARDPFGFNPREQAVTREKKEDMQGDLAAAPSPQNQKPHVKRPTPPCPLEAVVGPWLKSGKKVLDSAGRV